MFNQAKEDKIFLNNDVAQQLVSFHRQTLIDAYKQIKVFAGEEPSEEEIRSHYEAFSQSYVLAGAVKARHIECSTEAEALAAYNQLQGPGGRHLRRAWRSTARTKRPRRRGQPRLVQQGRLHRHVGGGAVLSEIVFDWDIGLHPPVEAGGNWHVVEILGRRPARQQALAEVRDRVIQELTPSLQAGILDATWRICVRPRPSNTTVLSRPARDAAPSN